jgi:hypothetical protein
MPTEIPEPGRFSMVWAMLLVVAVMGALMAFGMLMSWIWGFGR